MELGHSDVILLNIALAAALCGDANRALSVSDELARSYPKDIAINGAYLPDLRALLEARRGRPAAVAPESHDQILIGVAPLRYCRGEVYLAKGKGPEATAEFQKVVDNRGAMGFNVSYPAAYLGLARAAALTGDLAKSRKAYQDLFALWKDADPDLPVLLEAKREYKKLQPEK